MRVLSAIFFTAVASSVVHYTDNAVNYADYPQVQSGPDPGAAGVLIAWFAFTAFGIAGYVLYRRGRIMPAALCLAIYSGSGLVGILHYTMPSAGSMPWWRHAHIAVDIACGIAVLAFALWAARRASPATSPRAG